MLGIYILFLLKLYLVTLVKTIKIYRGNRALIYVSHLNRRIRPVQVVLHKFCHELAHLEKGVIINEIVG
jgi:hypothetical protein